ncbi:MAG: hypothetical protein JKY37_08530 [Nannocystaceae bacterium]|nr:hypothetical protein [Nannocystaceae bacterium]
MSSSLGPHGLSVVVDLLDSIGLGSGGIHLVVTERARTVRAEIEARRPPGWVIEALLASDRDRLCAAAYEDTAAQNIIF